MEYAFIEFIFDHRRKLLVTKVDINAPSDDDKPQCNVHDQKCQLLFNVPCITKHGSEISNDQNNASEVQ